MRSSNIGASVVVFAAIAAVLVSNWFASKRYFASVRASSRRNTVLLVVAAFVAILVMPFLVVSAALNVELKGDRTIAMKSLHFVWLIPTVLMLINSSLRSRRTGSPYGGGGREHTARQ